MQVLPRYQGTTAPDFPRKGVPAAARAQEAPLPAAVTPMEMPGNAGGQWLLRTPLKTSCIFTVQEWREARSWGWAGARNLEFAAKGPSGGRASNVCTSAIRCDQRAGGGYGRTDAPKHTAKCARPLDFFLHAQQRVFPPIFQLFLFDSAATGLWLVVLPGH